MLSQALVSPYERVCMRLFANYMNHPYYVEDKVKKWTLPKKICSTIRRDVEGEENFFKPTKGQSTNRYGNNKIQQNWLHTRKKNQTHIGYPIHRRLKIRRKDICALAALQNYVQRAAIECVVCFILQLYQAIPVYQVYLLQRLLLLSLSTGPSKAAG